MVQRIFNEIKDLGLQREVMDALPYAVVPQGVDDGTFHYSALQSRQ